MLRRFWNKGCSGLLLFGVIFIDCAEVNDVPAHGTNDQDAVAQVR